MARTTLSTQGYGIIKESLSTHELAALRTELTVAPFVPKDFQAVQKPSPFKVFAESPKKIYVPKSYGLKKFGAPDNNKLFDSVGTLEPCEAAFEGRLRPEQEQPVRELLAACRDPSRMGGILNVFCGGGKCLAKGTMVLMYDGTAKPVENILKGDLLMGDDSKARRVISTCRGQEAMYRISPAPGYEDYAQPFVVNESHILSLTKGSAFYDIPLKEFLEGKEAATAYHSYRRPIFAPVRGLSYSDRMSMMEKGPKWLANSLGYSVKRATGEVFEATSWPFIIEPLGVGEYYGFELVGENRRFVLADDFTVTHNTTMALYCITQLAKKALIIVHKDFLLNQWKERIEAFVPTARVGLIKAKTLDVENKDIVLASLQSLSMKEYDAAVFSGFGTVVIDEVHHTSAEVFSQALRKVCFPYTIGLSATINRKDGLGKVFMWHLGDVVFRSTKRIDEVKVHVHNYYDHSPRYSAEHFIMGDKPNMARMINNICNFEPRTLFIIEQLEKVLDAEPERHVLILSDRRSHLETLYKLIEERGYDVGLYYGGLKLEDCENKPIIVATFAIAAEGYDQPGLDTIIFASPKSDVVQAVGRILRDKPQDRKHTPLIIDIVDTFSIFRNQGRKRIKYYKSMGYTITTTFIDDSDDEKRTIIPQGVCLL